MFFKFFSYRGLLADARLKDRAAKLVPIDCYIAPTLREHIVRVDRAS